MDTVRRQQTKGIGTLLGDPRKAIIKLSIPMVLGSFGQIMLYLTDAIFISGLGPDALSAVGFFVPVFMIILSIAVGISAGGSAALARMIGCRDDKGADDVAAHTVIGMIIVSVLITAPLTIFIKPLFFLLGAGDTIDLTVSYGRIMLIGAPMLSFLIAAISVFGAEGNTKRGAQGMALVAILNIMLDPLFIYTLQFGVAGAALASVVALSVGSVIFIYWLFIKKSSYVTIKFEKFRFKKKIVLDICSVGVPVFLSQILNAIGIVIMNLILIKVAGTDGVAIAATGSRVINLILLPGIGLTGAFGTVAASAFGANDIDRLKTALKYVLRLGFIIEACLAAATFVLAPIIIKMFMWSDNTARIAEDLIMFFHITAFSLPVVVFIGAGISVFFAAGKGLNGLIITFFYVFLFWLPCVWFFGVYLDMGLIGVWGTGVFTGWIAAFIILQWVNIFIDGLKQDKVKLEKLVLEES